MDKLPSSKITQKKKTATKNLKEKKIAKNPKTRAPSVKNVKTERSEACESRKILEVPHSNDNVKNTSSDQLETQNIEKTKTVRPSVQTVKDELSQKTPNVSILTYCNLQGKRPL